MDATFVSDATLDELPQPSCLGTTKIGGIDINKPRTRTVLNAILSLACAPRGFTVGDFADSVLSMKDSTLLQYRARRAAYDLKKLRAKNLLTKLDNSRRYSVNVAVQNMQYDFLTWYQFSDLLGAAVKVFVVELKLSTEFVGTTVNFF
jgi:hypothetical protein